MFRVWPPPRIPVTTRIITCLIGNPYNPSFTTVTVRGPYPNYVAVLELSGVWVPSSYIALSVCCQKPWHQKERSIEATVAHGRRYSELITEPAKKTRKTSSYMDNRNKVAQLLSWDPKRQIFSTQSLDHSSNFAQMNQKPLSLRANGVGRLASCRTSAKYCCKNLDGSKRLGVSVGSVSGFRESILVTKHLRLGVFWNKGS